MTEKDALLRFAPALKQNMRQALGGDHQALEQLADLFNFVFAHGGREADSVSRRPDESFNPKAARVVQILISTGNERSADIFSAAMLATIGQHYWSDAPCSDQARSLVNAPQIVHVSTLDTIRHLHQSNLSTEQKLAEISRAKQLINTMADDSPYKPLLSHAVVQQERRCTPR